MSTQSWVTLIACIGELAVVLLVALRASGSPLATPLLLLSIDLAAGTSRSSPITARARSAGTSWT
jgi:hypothetical protein